MASRFGVMYACLAERPRLWSAVAWGLVLEGAMLLTPYAEVFGYNVTSKFLSITIGAHVVYGVALWAGLNYWTGNVDFHSPKRRPLAAIIAGLLIAPLGVALTAIDFHTRHAAAIPASPPGYIGPHLYTTWNVMEPDRLALLWLHKKYVDPQARYHFVEPFSQIRFGIPLDVPEAEIRRTGGDSATQRLLDASNIPRTERIEFIAHATEVYEISPWLLPSEPEIKALGDELRAIAAEEPTDPQAVLRKATLLFENSTGEAR